MPIAIGRTVRVLVFAALTVLASSVRAPAATDGGLLPRADLLQSALAAYCRLDDAGMLKTRLLTVIDYSLPSWERRLWVLDPTHGLRVLFHEFVAHGRGSASDEDPDRAVVFGNEPSSHRSSLGAFLTGATYAGGHGRSLELIGLDPGVNDKAFERRIVMHPAAYVSADFRAKKGGRVGRSWGCPALDPAVATAVIDRIGAGSLLYAAATTSGTTVAGASSATAVGPRQF